ncbi:MAG TPA: hypothetical protein VFY69_06505 [Solirubrobacterales bacterium]|nr:hypothetical protein [Solirubrobacterales bacterium]
MRSAETDQSTRAKTSVHDPSELLCTGESYLERLGVLCMDRLRLQIVTELFGREMTPAQFHEGFGGRSYSSVRRHFMKLVETGWLRPVRPMAYGPGPIRRGRTGTLHRATELPVIDNETFEGFPISIRDTLTVQFLEEMGCRLGEAMEAGIATDGRERIAHFQAAELDEQGWCKALAAVEDCFKVLYLIQTDAKTRIEHGHGRPLSMIVSLAAFELPPAETPGPFATELPPVDPSSLARHHWPQRIGKVFIDPLNLAIIDVLNRATMTANELYDHFALRTPRALRERCEALAQLGMLTVLGGDPLAGSNRDARSHRFQATSPRTSKAAILRPVPASARGGDVWRAFDRFSSASVDALQAGTFNSRSERHLTLNQLLVDNLGWMQVTEALTACTDSLARVEREARSRQDKKEQKADTFTIGLMVTGFEAPHRNLRS